MKETYGRDVNPFKMPAENEIFLLRDQERQRKLQERLDQKKLKIWQKSTALTRMTQNAAAVRTAEMNEARFAEEEKARAEKEDQHFTLNVTRNRHADREPLDDYINKKREMFLVQYSLNVKRDEMRKLEEIALAEERKLEKAEQYLEEDAALFDEFLKENDRNASDAIKIAEAETKAKLEKVAEIKRINSQMMAIKSEISKYEDTLKEYKMYKNFLTSITPKEWLSDTAREKLQRKEQRRKQKELKMMVNKPDTSDLADESGLTVKTGGSKMTGPVSSTNISAKDLVSGDADSLGSLSDSDDDSDEDPELFFTDPQQLLDIFAELEEQNLSLIQNSQETEEALEEMKQTVKNTKAKMEKETDILKEQIERLNTAIAKEEEKAHDLETKARMFSFGEFKADDQEKMLSLLNKKVEDVYRSCIGDNEANISTLQMLTNIENRLEELFEQIESLPPDKVEAAEKTKEKERRLRMREEKIAQQKLHQDERLRKALERAKAEPKKKLGRRLMPRSEPPQLKKVHDVSAEQASREEEELAYYFMP